MLGGNPSLNVDDVVDPLPIVPNPFRILRIDAMVTPGGLAL